MILPIVVAAGLAVAPASYAQIVKLDTKRITAPRAVTAPPSLSTTQKISVVKAALKGKVPETKTMNFVSPIKLDTQHQFSGKTQMLFDWPSEVAGVYNYTYFDQAKSVEPRIRLFLDAPTPGFYLFDFAVDNESAGYPAQMTFINLFGSDKQERPMSNGPQHQLFVTNVPKAGENLIVFSSTGSWRFHSLEISKLQ